MGLFSNESKSSTKVNAPVEKSPITADNASVAVRSGGAVFQTDTLGTGASQFRLGKNARVNITQTADPKLLSSIVANQNQTLQQFLDGTAAQSETQGKGLADVLSKLTDLAESKQTGGESARDKTISYIVLAALGVVALWLIFGRGK